MANTSTDLTEEDAADLQFPKEMQDNFQCENRTIDHSDDKSALVHTCSVCFNLNYHCLCVKCLSCLRPLEIPYIECSECDNVNICCRCFASGIELYSHKSYHKYRVMKHDMVLFDKSNWTAEEELIVLDVLFTYGYGNWEMISKKLPHRTEQEIKNHYDKFYLDESVLELPKAPGTDKALFPKHVVAYRFRLTNIEEPPRFAPDTTGYQSLAGYWSARSDFEMEFDANCEDILAKLTNTDVDESHPRYELMCELQVGLVLSYNRRVRERMRRKRVLREHGLVLLRKTMSSLHRYEPTLTRPVAERLLNFMQLLGGEEFDLLMEGLHRTAQLKQTIAKLREYRHKGIRTLQAAEVYEWLRVERERSAKELKVFESNPLFCWTQQVSGGGSGGGGGRRALARPLDVGGLPGCERLTAHERSLCAAARLPPLTYLQLKELLLAENKRSGHVRLLTARKMLKIDVNKTRKLYDFLLHEGYITKPIN